MKEQIETKLKELLELTAQLEHSREKSLVITKLEEAELWLSKVK